MTRQELLHKLTETGTTWDIVVIGGGATGLGIALDAALRGYKTLLLEQADFAKGTSSRSTKLIHGGVRYLAQGKIALVFEALKERGLLLQNAAHLVKKQTFIIPVYSWKQALKYLLGLKFYDLLAGKWSLGASRFLSKKQTISALPTVKIEGLHGGILYYDSQFDDARLALNIAQSATAEGACVLNYMRVTSLIKNNLGKVAGVKATDEETGNTFSINANAVINATGVFADQILQMENPKKRSLVQPSQGVHLVLDRSFLPATSALLIPETADKRVLFAVPWQDHLLLGTTDTLVQQADLEPVALHDEIRFILNTAGQYLSKAPQTKDILAVFAGLRPLAAQADNGKYATKDISRNYKILIAESGLLSIIGGKWTIYRKMAEDAVTKAAKVGQLPVSQSKTKNYPIHGSGDFTHNDHLAVYGSDAPALLQLTKQEPALQAKLHPDFPYITAQVIWAVRHEFARTIEDVLARRIRLLFLNAQAALEAAPKVADLMANELNKDEAWREQQLISFNKLATNYLYTADSP